MNAAGRVSRELKGGGIENVAIDELGGPSDLAGGFLPVVFDDLPNSHTEFERLAVQFSQSWKNCLKPRDLGKAMLLISLQIRTPIFQNLLS